MADQTKVAPKLKLKQSDVIFKHVLSGLSPDSRIVALPNFKNKVQLQI